MRILVDENLPVRFFKELFGEFDVQTVNDLGWSGIKNGELMKRIEGNFDLFITADKNIQYQQNLDDRTFSIVEVFTNRLPLLKDWSERILETIRSVSGNEYKRIGPEQAASRNPDKPVS